MSGRVPIPSWALFQIGERDRWQCHVCRQGYLPNDPWEIDHDVPLAKGGTNLLNNMRLSHRTCNQDKAAA